MVKQIELMTQLENIASNSAYGMYNKHLARHIGLNQAVLIGELLSERKYWRKEEKLTDDYFFYSTQDNIEENTSLTIRKQRLARKKLEGLNLIVAERRGTHGTYYYKINDNEVLNLINKPLTKDSKPSSNKMSHDHINNLTRNKMSRDHVTKCNVNNNNNKNKNISNNLDKSRLLEIASKDAGITKKESLEKKSSGNKKENITPEKKYHQKKEKISPTPSPLPTQKTPKLTSPDEKKKMRSDVIECLVYLKEKLNGFKLDKSDINFIQCKHLLRQFKKEYPDVNSVQKVKELIDAAMNDDFYSPMATNFLFLKKNQSAILRKAKSINELNIENINDSDVISCHEHFVKIFGHSPDGSPKINEGYNKQLLAKFKKDYPDKNPVHLVKKLIELAHKDKFHFKFATTFKYLYNKAEAIIASSKERNKLSTTINTPGKYKTGEEE